MTTLIELALPCRVVTLEFITTGSDGMSTLEGFITRAALLGLNTSAKLAKFFGLPERVVVEVVGGLWATGLVTIDPDGGTIEVSDTARERLVASQGKTPTLDLPGTSQRRNFLFEPVTGVILPVQEGQVRPRDGSVRLPVATGLSEADIPRDELVRSVQTVVRREKTRGSTTIVRSVSFGNPMLRTGEVMRWLHVLVEAHVDAATKNVWIATQDRVWDGEAGRRLRGHVSALVAQEPEQDFARQLSGRAHHRFESPDRLDVLLGQMAQKIDKLANSEPALAQQRYKELLDTSGRIQDRITALNRTRAAITPVTGGAGHEWAVNELIDNARRQLVLVAPMLAYPQVRALLPKLRGAIARGVRLVVMWGQAPDDQLPKPVLSALNEIQRDPNAIVLLADRSSRTQACLVIQDDTRALVGSHNPLDGSSLGRDALSTLIEPADKGPLPVPAVVDLLIWARQNYPYWRHGRRIMLHRHEFDPDGELDERQPTTAAVTTPESIAERQTIDAAAVRVWATSWLEYYTALVEAAVRSEQVGPAVRVVTDSELTSTFWGAVRTADRRLVVADDRVDTRVANADLAEAIRARRAAGAQTLLLHPRIPGAGKEADPFSSLAGNDSGIVVRHGRAGCRAVVTEREVLIGSLSPLGRGVATTGSIRVSQVSLHIEGQDMATRIAELLGAAPIEVPAPAATVSVERSASPELVAGPALLDARTAPDMIGFAERVVDRLGALEDPWRVLEIWRQGDDPVAAESGERTRAVPEAELRIAVAALLRKQVGTDLPGALTWAKWLVVHAWERREFVEAALLAQRLPATERLRDCAALNAALEAGPLGRLLDDAAWNLVDAGRSARAAGAVGVLADVLLHNGENGVEVLENLDLVAALPPAWRGLAEEAQAFHRGRVGALPLRELEDVTNHAAAISALAASARELYDKIEKMRKLRQRFSFDSGEALHDGLFAKDGLLTRIGAAAAAGVPAFADLCMSLPNDTKNHLDQIVADANEKPMVWHKHVSFLNNVQDMVRTARDLADAAVRTDAPPDDLPQVRAATALGEYVAGQWELLFAEAGSAIAHPHDLPARALLDQLSPLARWRREQR